MKVLITNFGDKSIELPRELEVGTSHEGWEQQTPIMKVLEPVQPLPISPIQLAARRGYVIEQLKISENTMLQGEFDIQEKLIKLFIDNWNAISIRGSHGVWIPPLLMSGWKLIHALYSLRHKQLNPLMRQPA